MMKIFAALIVVALAPAIGVAQDSQLVGTWKLVAADVQRPDGRVLPDYGSAPSGMAIFTADGQYMIEIYRGPADRMKFAANDRSKGTCDEYRDAQLSTSASFGRYTVDQANHTIAFATTSSSYPNRDGKTQVEPFTLQNDSLAWRVVPRPDGSVPISRFVRVR
jgi:Lipocalin-like domain